MLTPNDLSVEERLKPVIRFPVKLQEKALKRKEKKRLEGLVQGFNPGDRTRTPIIDCRRSQLNHYPGQVYKKWKKLPLASEHWYSRRSIGDFFTFTGTGPTSHRPATSGDKPKAGSFPELGLRNEELSRKLRENGFHKPTLIQSMAIPELIRGKTSLIASETGNGKTLAFLLPTLQICADLKRENGDRPLNSPSAAVVTPSKELAAQIYRVALSLNPGLTIHFAGESGRFSSNRQRIEHEPRGVVDLVIGPFGSLAKMFRYGLYSYDGVHKVVLDEADTLLDDTFNPFSVSFLKNFPKGQTQVVMVGATHPTSLEPILGRVVPLESLTKIVTPKLHRILSHVRQTFIRVPAVNRDEYLLEVIEKDAAKNKPLVIFCNKSSTAEFVRLRLKEANFTNVCGLHSGFSDRDRKRNLKQFSAGKSNLLVCTDLASRGIDTVRCSHVINYEFPLNMSDYVHRVGRVGRVGSPAGAKVTSFVRGPVEVKILQQIEESVRRNRELANVNNNIIRILQHRQMKKGENIQGEDENE